MLSWMQSKKDCVTNWSTQNPWKVAGVSIAAPIALLTSHYLYQKLTNRMNGIPPGPYHAPMIGVMPYIMANYDKNDKNSLALKLADDYGDIVCYNIMGLKIIQINNSKLAKKIMSDKQYREISTTIYQFGQQPLFAAKDGEQNFVALNGSKWAKRRKLFLSVFNKILTTKFMNKVSGTSIKNIFIPEINQYIKENKPYLPRDTMRYLSFSTVFYANFDRFIDKDDALYIRFKNSVEKSMDLQQTDEWIAAIMWNKSLSQKFYDARDELSDIVNELMDERRAELKKRGINYINPDDEKTDNKEVMEADNDLSEVVKDLEFDSYLDYLLKLVDEGKIKNSVAEVETLLLFVGGYQNIALSLEWTLVIAAKYQSIQKRIREELFGVMDIKENAQNIGNDMNEFDLSRTVQCPLFRAFIHEALRKSSFTRNSLARCIEKDTEIEWKGKKYILPKGYMLSYIIEYMSKNSKNEDWKSDVNEFDLNNFLDENGKFKMNESFALFGYGVRDCPGRAFAIKQIQIFLAYIVMNYHIEFSDEEKRKNPQNVNITADRKKFTLEIEPQIPLKFTPL